MKYVILNLKQVKGGFMFFRNFFKEMILIPFKGSTISRRKSLSLGNLSFDYQY
jgi:hypothetical protein